MQPLSSRQKILGLAGFLCLLLFILSYFVYHKPLTPGIMLALGTVAARLASAAMLMCLGGGLGVWLWRQAGRRYQPIQHWDGGGLEVIQGSLGLYLVALVWLGVGLLAGYKVWVAWGLLLVSLVVLRREVLTWVTGFKHMLPEARSGFERLVRFCLVWMALLSLMVALAPPLKYDALVYHLAFPAEYVAQGRFVFLPHNIYWGWPQTGEMLYTWAALLAGYETAAVLGWMTAALALMGLMQVVKHAAGRMAAWGAAAALMGGSSLAGAWSWAYVDWLAILYGVAWLAIWSATAWQEPDRPSASPVALTVLAGILAGMAIGVKYTAGVLMICGLALILWRSWRSPRDWLRSSFIYGMAGTLAALPWLIKNILATGSPIYPLLFQAGPMTALRLSAYQSHVSKSTWMDFLLLPWRVTFVGQENAPGYASSIGPLLFGLPLAALVAWPWLDDRGRQLARMAAVTTAAGVMLWMILGQVFPFLLQARLYYAFFPLLAALAGIGLWGLQSVVWKQVRFGRLANALVALVIILNALDITTDVVQKAPLELLFGQQSAQEYRVHNLGWFVPAMQAVKDLPEGSHVLLLFETRYLPCQPVCLPDEILDRWLVARHSEDGVDASSEQILQQWRSEGFTHVLLHQAGVDFLKDDPYLLYTPADWQALDELLGGLHELHRFGSAYRLYRLTP